MNEWIVKTGEDSTDMVFVSADHFVVAPESGFLLFYDKPKFGDESVPVAAFAPGWWMWVKRNELTEEGQP